jgi:hypothetical protein
LGHLLSTNAWDAIEIAKSDGLSTSPVRSTDEMVHEVDETDG